MKNLTNKLLILLFFIYCKSTDAQQWTKYYGNSLEDKAYAITIDVSGNVYISGYWTFTSSGKDFYTIKINPQTGNQIWAQRYNGPASQEDKVYAITLDRLGNVYVAGYSTGLGTGKDMTVVKYSSSGSKQWDARYNSTTNGDDVAYAVTVDDSLNVYIAGYVSLTGEDMYIAKFNSSGAYQWGRFKGGTANTDDKAYAIVLDNSNNVYIGGYTTNIGKGADFTLIKYNRYNGDTTWVRKYDGPANGDDIAVGMALSSQNNILITGTSKDGRSTSTDDFWTMRVEPVVGDTVWTRRYCGSGEGEDKVYAITVDKLDNVYITGSTYTAALLGGLNNYNLDYMTIKYSFNGEQLWNTSYDSNYSNDIARALFVSNSGNYLFVTGSSRKENNPDSQDVVTVKYDVLTGSQMQKSVIKGPGKGEDDAYGVCADTFDNVYVAGYVKNVTTGFDYFASRYFRGDLIDVKNISTKVPGSYALYQNYPNPFNPSTTIKFDVFASSHVKLIIYNVLGMEIAIPVNEYLRIGTYEVTYNASDLASGVYFYELVTDDYRNIKKMILLK